MRRAGAGSAYNAHCSSCQVYQQLLMSGAVLQALAVAEAALCAAENARVAAAAFAREAADAAAAGLHAAAPGAGHAAAGADMQRCGPTPTPIGRRRACGSGRACAGGQTREARHLNKYRKMDAIPGLSALRWPGLSAPRAPGISDSTKAFGLGRGKQPRRACGCRGRAGAAAACRLAALAAGEARVGADLLSVRRRAAAQRAAAQRRLARLPAPPGGGPGALPGWRGV